MLEASIEVRNAGYHDGDEVVQIYGKKLDPRHDQSKQQLLAFRRICLKKGEVRRVIFSLPALELAYWDVVQKRFVVEGGTYEIRFGASSADIRLEKQIELSGRCAGIASRRPNNTLIFYCLTRRQVR